MVVLWWLYIFLVAVGFIFMVQYCWLRYPLYKISNELPGPPALPIVGNGLNFVGKTTDVLKAIENVTKNYSKPMRFWLGPVLVIYFVDPKHVEKILTSKSLLYKHDIYEFLKIYLGDGLISGSGEKWKRNRKVIQPLFNTKFINSCMDVFKKHFENCMEILEGHVNKETFDIHDTVHMCFIDIIGEIIMGTKINAQNGKNRNFIRATIDIYDQCYKRLVKPWYQSDLIYTVSGDMQKQNALIEELCKFLRNILQESITRIKKEDVLTNEERSYSPIIDQIMEAFDKESIIVKDQEIMHHILTLFLASEDTMTLISSFVCLLLGMYPQYQEIAANEIRSVFGERSRSVNYEDLSKLVYLEMCIKDTLRLIPIAPFILRKTIEKFEIDNVTIPKDCGILIAIFELHRDRKYWEQPNQFYPDHFLPETVNSRHLYAYIPFSAGPRGCIGKQLAMNGMKMLMAYILQKFEITAEGNIADIKLSADISVRSQDGYKVQLKRRVWK